MKISHNKPIGKTENETINIRSTDPKDFEKIIITKTIKRSKCAAESLEVLTNNLAMLKEIWNQLKLVA